MSYLTQAQRPNTPKVTGIVYVSPDGSGDYTSLPAALTAEGATKRYILGPGTHSLTAQLLTSLNNIEVEGSGVDKTIIRYDMGDTVAGFKVAGSLSSAFVLTADTLRGTRVITVTSTTGLTAGDWIFLRRQVETTIGATGRYDAEFHKIETVDSGTQITVEDQVFDDYLTANSSDYYKVTWVTNFSIKNLTLYDNRTGLTNMDQGDTLFSLCYNLHIENVKFENMAYASCTVESCFNTTLTNVYFERPREHSGNPGILYGLYVTGATTNLVWNGGWANRCRHSMTTNTNSAAVVRAGRRRSIIIANVNSYNATVANFDTHEGDVGVVYSNCGILAGHHGTVTTDVQGFNCRSPTFINSCWIEGATQEAFVLFNGTDSLVSGLIAGGDRMIISNCRIGNTLPGDAGSTSVGIHINPNRSSVSIIGNQFFNVRQRVLRLDPGCNNIRFNNNMLTNCGTILSSVDGLIYTSGTVTNLDISHNTFASESTVSGRPVFCNSPVNRVNFVGNDVFGHLSGSRMPLFNSGSTEVRIKENIGLNPIGKIANPFGNTNLTVGAYGGTTTIASGSQNYLVVGGDVLVTVISGATNSISILDNSTIVLVSGLQSLEAQHVPYGCKINFGATAFSGGNVPIVVAI